jgi:hypothetical protein
VASFCANCRRVCPCLVSTLPALACISSRMSQASDIIMRNACSQLKWQSLSGRASPQIAGSCCAEDPSGQEARWLQYPPLTTRRASVHRCEGMLLLLLHGVGASAGCRWLALLGATTAGTHCWHFRLSLTNPCDAESRVKAPSLKYKPVQVMQSCSTPAQHCASITWVTAGFCAGSFVQARLSRRTARSTLTAE